MATLLSFTQLAERWAALHAASLSPLRRLAAAAADGGDSPTSMQSQQQQQQPSSSSLSLALSRLPPGTLEPSVVAAALAREAAGRGESTTTLENILDEMEDLLEQMHALAREARREASSSSSSSSNSGEDADSTPPRRLLHKITPAERAAALAAPLRCYEAELSLKRHVLSRLSSSSSSPESSSDSSSADESRAVLQALARGWEAEPLLQPVEAMRAGWAAQEALDKALHAAAVVEEVSRPTSPSR